MDNRLISNDTASCECAQDKQMCTSLFPIMSRGQGDCPSTLLTSESFLDETKYRLIVIHLGILNYNFNKI
jgi:hypothetical protein